MTVTNVEVPVVFDPIEHNHGGRDKGKFEGAGWKEKTTVEETILPRPYTNGRKPFHLATEK